MLKFSDFRWPLHLALVLALLCGTGPAQAQKQASTPALQFTINKVLGRAQYMVGKPMARGIILSRARQHGDIVMFDLMITDPLLLRAARSNPALLYREFITKTGRSFCKKGKNTRKFVDAGGEVQFVMYDNRRKMLTGGRLTKCK